MPHNKVSTWLKTIPVFKFLFLLALFLLSYALIAQQFLKSETLHKERKHNNQMVELIMTSTQQQLEPLIQSNNLEAISKPLNKLMDYKTLYKVAIYKPNGSLVKERLNSNINPKNLESKVTVLTDEQQDLGYLIYQFEKPNSVIIGHHLWFYYLAAVLWFLACLLFMFRIKKASIAGQEIPTKRMMPLSYKKELQALLKRSQSQEEPSNLLIIKANWQAYNQKPRQPLLSLLNRWTAHNQSHLVSFDQDLLVLGLNSQPNIEALKKVQVLEHCLQALGIKSTILLHSLNFGETVYHHFFSIVENGIWIESRYNSDIDDTLITIKQDIEIELEEFGQFHLYKIDARKAEDAIYFERQTRFFLQ